MSEKEGNKVLLTGITVREQMYKARRILEQEVIPLQNTYDQLKREQRLNSVKPKEFNYHAHPDHYSGM
jgi:hypothetical protein